MKLKDFTAQMLGTAGVKLFPLPVPPLNPAGPSVSSPTKVPGLPAEHLSAPDPIHVTHGVSG